MASRISRRKFVSTTAAATAGVMIVPRHVLARSGVQAPSDRLNIAICGAGGRGTSMATELLNGGHNLGHICDVDQVGMNARIARSTQNAQGQPVPARVALQAAYNKAPRSTDFRRMLEQRDLDGIVIATPDHTHAVIAKAAMESGKHVYVEKPLTWSVHEARVLREVAKRTGVVTQMGNQGQSTDGARLINEWIQAGLIGRVSEVHMSTDRPVWPQGVPRPPRNPATLPATAYTSRAPLAPGAGGGGNDWNSRRVQFEMAKALGSHPVPTDMQWDLFLGPAPVVPFHPIYHPFNWRGWLDWGVGAVGDIAAHTLNHPYWALGLTYPETVEATSSPFGLDEDGNPASYPAASEIVFRYASSTGPVTMYWRDGGLWSPRPDALPAGVDHRNAVVMIGDKGILVHATYGNNPKLYPESLMEAAAKVPQRMARVPGQLHCMNWANAIKTKTKATSDFEYASRLTENMLLGIVALKTGQGVQIRYDGATGTIPGNATANGFLQREYRRGWTL